MPAWETVRNMGSAEYHSPIYVQRLSTQSEEVHRQPAEEESLQAKEALGHTLTATPELQTHIHSLQRGGQPLPESTRAFMEPRFGYNFSKVRIHNDERAAESAHAVQARAYTVGKNVVFGAREFAPQTSEGSRLLAHELTHVVQQGSGIPAPAKETIFRKVEGIAVAGILDYYRLAIDIRNAVIGTSTNKEAVYVALRSLQRESAAIKKLKYYYKANFGETLEKSIRDHFSGNELQYALQLIGMRTSVPTLAIGKVPRTDTQFNAVEMQLHDAIDRKNVEVIYSVLTVFERNQENIKKLDEAYINKYHQSIRNHLGNNLSGPKLEYSLHLLGEEKMEATQISLAEATRLFKALSHATFLTATGKREPVPFHYPPDGCYDRAYVMSSILTQMGYASEKVFAVSTLPPLRVATPYARDVPVGTPPEQTWRWHVAPIIRIYTSNAPYFEERVIDPSLFDRPVILSDWTKKMGVSTYGRLTKEQLLAKLHAAIGSYFPYPTSQPQVFTVSRNVYFLPEGTGYSLPTSASEAIKEHKEVIGGVGGHLFPTYVEKAKVHEIAAAIRVALHGTPVSVNAIVEAIRAKPAAVRSQLWGLFPQLHVEVMIAIPDSAARKPIEDAVTLP